MAIALVGNNPIDWSRPEGCPAGFETVLIKNENLLIWPWGRDSRTTVGGLWKRFLRRQKP